MRRAAALLACSAVPMTRPREPLSATACRAEDEAMRAAVAPCVGEVAPPTDTMGRGDGRDGNGAVLPACLS